MLHIKKKAIIRIQSRLYYDIFCEGGDRLLSVYATLKSCKGLFEFFPRMQAKNGKVVTGINLLHHFSGIPKQTLKKYVPSLIKLKLLRIDKEGNVHLKGNNKLNKIYRGKHRLKLVPIAIGSTIAETATYVRYVRIHANVGRQNQQIAQKILRNEILEQGSASRENAKIKISKEKYAKFLKLEKEYGKKKIDVQTQSVLSLESFGKLSNRGLSNLKSGGNYYKRKFLKYGMIASQRRFDLVQQAASFEEYKFMKQNSFDGHKLNYKRGCIVREVVSHVKPTSFSVQNPPQDFIKNFTPMILPKMNNRSNGSKTKTLTSCTLLASVGANYFSLTSYSPTETTI